MSFYAIPVWLSYWHYSRPVSSLNLPLWFYDVLIKKGTVLISKHSVQTNYLEFHEHKKRNNTEKTLHLNYHTTRYTSTETTICIWTPIRALAPTLNTVHNTIRILTQRHHNYDGRIANRKITKRMNRHINIITDRWTMLYNCIKIISVRINNWMIG